MTRTVNAETLSHVKRWEGCELIAYPDPGSVDGNPWTIGYGHTGANVRRGLTITKDKADEWLEADLNLVAAFVESVVTVALTDNQFGALVSFTFNVGNRAFKTSTLLKKLNAGDYAAVPAQLARWNKNDGKVMSGLVNRRAAEAGLWARGAEVASNTVEAKPSAPSWVNAETVAAGGGLLTGAAGVASGSGPVQWAVGAVLIIAAVVVGFLIISKRVNPK